MAGWRELLGLFGWNKLGYHLACDGRHGISILLTRCQRVRFSRRSDGVCPVGRRRDRSGQCCAIGAGNGQRAGFGKDEEPLSGDTRVGCRFAHVRRTCEPALSRPTPAASPR